MVTYYIIAKTKDNKNFKLIFSPEYKEIEFIFSYKTVMDAIKKGDDYRVVYSDDGKLVIGSKIVHVDEFMSKDKLYHEHIISIHNDTLKDNLMELPIFEIVNKVKK